MLSRFIRNRIEAQLPFTPNDGQKQAIDSLCGFLIQRDERVCFILRGYAGTGKTSLVGALVRALAGMQIPCVLMAPTGRAAKVMNRYSGLPAYTIHRAIYRSQSAQANHPDAGHFSLAPNMLQGAVIIVDEASMLSSERDNPMFGSGCLIDDLVRWVYNGKGCRLLLVGDDAQLPPVGQTASRALDSRWMEGYDLHVSEHTLTEVARQAEASGILRNATRLRAGEEQMDEYADFQTITPDRVMDTIERSYREAGEDETLVVTRSNFRTNLFNQGIRARILWRENLLEAGDRIMVSRNNYAEEEEFIANGEMFTIRRLRNERELYGFHFADAELSGIDREFEIQRTVWLDTLTTDTPEQSFGLQRQLFDRIAEDYPEIRDRKKLAQKVMESPYYNALQIRYAYAVTCHKAQGGQWKHVLIDMPPRREDEEANDYQRWLYTAITRATEQIYTIKSEKESEK